MNTASQHPRHVLMSADTVGGVWTYAMELCEGLCRQGIRVSLATMGALPHLAQRQQAEAIDGLDLYESSFRLEWMDDPWSDVDAAGLWLLRLQQQTNADLVHLNGYSHAALDWPVSVVTVAHSCVLSWWQSVKGGPAPEMYELYRHRVTRGVRAADALVAPTAWMLHEVDRDYGHARFRAVVPNARSGRLFRPEEKEDFVFCCGRVWDEAKNISVLCDAAPHLRWPVVVAGDSRHPSGAMNSVPNVEFLGRMPETDIAALLARASIYALPALYEPFGLSALEAALSGCAVVLGDIPSLREVWNDCAIYVPPRDERALAEAINSLIANEEYRKDMALRASQRAMHYSQEHMTQNYLTVYQTAMRNAAKRDIASCV